MERKAHMLAAYNWSFGVQRSVGFNTVADVAYVATRGRHLGQTRDVNELPYGSKFLPENQDPTSPGRPLPDNFFRPYPGYSNISYLEFAGNSTYDSLQTHVRRRFSRGLQFGAAWTWSKARGNTDSYNGSVSSYFNTRVWNWDLAGYDRTHILSANWLWNIPRASSLWNKALIRGALTAGGCPASLRLSAASRSI